MIILKEVLPAVFTLARMELPRPVGQAVTVKRREGWGLAHEPVGAKKKG